MFPGYSYQFIVRQSVWELEQHMPLYVYAILLHGSVISINYSLV